MRNQFLWLSGPLSAPMTWIEVFRHLPCLGSSEGLLPEWIEARLLARSLLASLNLKIFWNSLKDRITLKIGPYLRLKHWVNLGTFYWVLSFEISSGFSFRWFWFQLVLEPFQKPHLSRYDIVYFRTCETDCPQSPCICTLYHEVIPLLDLFTLEKL